MAFSAEPISSFDRLDDEDDTAPKGVVTGRRALLTAALAQSDLGDLTRAITAPSSQIVLISVPSAQWAKALAGHLHHQLPDVIGRAVVELKKDNNRGLFAEFTDHLGDGMHLVIVSHDPQMLLPSALLAAVDATFTLALPRTKLLRQAIEALTGEAVRNLRASDFAGLDFDALATALRPGSKPGDCLSRLRRASKVLRRPQNAIVGPTLADLPLSPDITAWSNGLLGDLRRVSAGKQAAADLRYPLLEGPPGTGKTLLASAVARSAGWRLVTTSVGSWFSGSDGHLGGVNKAVAEFFNELLRENCSIGFIDEVDAIPNRAHLDEKDRSWWTPVVTQILLQIDRVRRSGRPVMLIGATNLYNSLDPALTRGGRLEQRVSVLPPRTVGEIEAIFTHHLKGELDPAAVHTAAQWSLGKTPADIEAMVRAARSLAALASRPMTARDLLDSVVPAETRSAAELRATAIHEAGHAIVSLRLGLPVETVSIIADGERGGFTRGEMINRFPNRAEIEALAMVMLGGRAADIVLGKGAHSGAERDLAMATNVLGRAINEFGLYDSLAHNESLVALRRVDPQLEALLQILLKRAKEIVQQEQRAALALAEELLVNRMLNRAAVERIYRAHRRQTTTDEQNPEGAPNPEGRPS